MLSQPILDLVNARIKMGTIFEIHAHLAFQTTSTQVHHQLSGDIGGHARSTVLFEQPERHIDAGSHTGAGGDAMVMDVEHSIEHLSGWVARLEIGDKLPMGCTPPSVQQTGLAQDSGSRTD